MRLYELIFEYFNSVPFLIKIVWFISFVFFVILLILVISHIILRYFLFGSSERKIELLKFYEELIIEYLSYEQPSFEHSKEQKKIIEILKKEGQNKNNRKLIVKSLIKLQNEVSGELERSIFNLYDKTQLKFYAINKLSSKDDFKLVNGIRQLNIFQVDSELHKIKSLLGHPKHIVRNEVYLYLVKILKFEGLFFLDELKFPLSEWNQIQLLGLLNNFEFQDIHNISNWLESENNDVVMFALKLSRIYNLIEMHDLLIELLQHDEKKIRLKAIKVVSYLHILEGKELLKSIFNTISDDEKLIFIEELHHYVNTDDIEFLKRNICHEKFDIKFNALKLLYQLDKVAFDIEKTKLVDDDSVKIINYLIA